MVEELNNYQDGLCDLYFLIGILFGFSIVAIGAVFEYLHDYFYRKRLKKRINKNDLVNSIAYEYVRTILNPITNSEELAKAVSFEVNEVLNGKYRK